MKIVAVTCAFNESYMLPFWVKHYEKFCSRLIVYDNESNDATRLVAENLGCEVRSYSSSGFDILKIREIYSACLNEFKDYDFVINCDTDEFLYLKDGWYSDFFERAKAQNVNLFDLEGFEMASLVMPDITKQIYESIKEGVKSDSYNKSICYAPKLIENMNYSLGLHQCKPTGIICKNTNHNLKLLHFKFIGGIERIVERHKIFSERMETRQTKNISYLPEYTTIKYNKLLAKATKIV